MDLALLVNANGLTFEAANARHAHEWTIWRDIELPEGKYLIPGVVSHSTNVVEHPELVAQRIRQFADIVATSVSWRRRTVAWAAASTRRLRGRSWRLLPRALVSHRSDLPDSQAPGARGWMSIHPRAPFQGFLSQSSLFF